LQKRWSIAISDAHVAMHAHRNLFDRLVCYFNSKKCEVGNRAGDALNSEIKSVLLSGYVCEFVLREIRLSIEQKSFDTDELHNFAHVFGTYAVLACFNTLRIFQSEEVGGLILGNKQAAVIDILDARIPRIVEAGDAIRHHHDRIFSRVKNKKVGTNALGQMIAHWGPALKLTDGKMTDFYFEFSPARVSNALREIVEELER
jgi:hypothetical protein